MFLAISSTPVSFAHHPYRYTHPASLPSLSISIRSLLIISNISSYLAVITLLRKERSSLSLVSLLTSVESPVSTLMVSASLMSSCRPIEISLVTSSPHIGMTQYLRG